MYLKIATNNVADYVAFGGLPAPAFKYDGSFHEAMAIPAVIIAPSNTERAQRLANGILPHIIETLG